jgi:hypothetical protein
MLLVVPEKSGSNQRHCEDPKFAEGDEAPRPSAGVPVTM